MKDDRRDNVRHERRSGTQASRVRDGDARAHDERGAVLVLALVLLLVGVLIAGGVSYQVSNNLHNSLRFQQVRSVQFAARSTTNLAIQNIRRTPLLSTTQTLNASPPAPCWTTASGVSELTNIDGIAAMASWCSTAWSPTSAATRTVTVSTCPYDGAPNAAAQCAAAPYLEAVVTFDDYPSGVSPPNAAACSLYCGTSMVVDSWLWSPSVPTVTGISPGSGPATGGTALTVSGTGFGPDTTVNLVEGTVTGSPASFTPSNDNEVLSVPASQVTLHGSTSLTIATPAAVEGTTYAVTVTTMSGTSPFTLGAIFTYTWAAPRITTVSPSTGLPSTGGNLLTLTGTGFTRNARVTFTQESGGVVVNGGAVYTVTGAPFVTVASPTTMTVVSPGVTTIGSYFITVATPFGVSSPSTSQTASFTYVVPTVLSVTPNSGPDAGGTSITISGTGFLVGTSVSFNRTSSGCQSGQILAASNVTVSSASTITATSPSVSFANPYYVYVTTSSGPNTYSSNCYPIYTYTG